MIFGLTGAWERAPACPRSLGVLRHSRISAAAAFLRRRGGPDGIDRMDRRALVAHLARTLICRDRFGVVRVETNTGRGFES